MIIIGGFVAGFIGGAVFASNFWLESLESGEKVVTLPLL